MFFSHKEKPKNFHIDILNQNFDVVKNENEAKSEIKNFKSIMNDFNTAAHEMTRVSKKAPAPAKRKRVVDMSDAAAVRAAAEEESVLQEDAQVRRPRIRKGGGK